MDSCLCSETAYVSVPDSTLCLGSVQVKQHTDLPPRTVRPDRRRPRPEAPGGMSVYELYLSGLAVRASVLLLTAHCALAACNFSSTLTSHPGLFGLVVTDHDLELQVGLPVLSLTRPGKFWSTCCVCLDWHIMGNTGCTPTPGSQSRNPPPRKYFRRSRWGESDCGDWNGLS